MRLIDADALKEEINKKKVVGRFNTLLLIDNAPTVDIPTGLCKGCRFLKDCETCEEKLRPQGKWIYPEKTDKEKGYGGYCSNCKCDMPIFIEDWKQKYCETKFCPNCGAKMKCGAE